MTTAQRLENALMVADVLAKQGIKVMGCLIDGLAAAEHTRLEVDRFPLGVLPSTAVIQPATNGHVRLRITSVTFMGITLQRLDPLHTATKGAGHVH